MLCLILPLLQQRKTEREREREVEAERNPNARRKTEAVHLAAPLDVTRPTPLANPFFFAADSAASIPVRHEPSLSSDQIPISTDS